MPPEDDDRVRARPNLGDIRRRPPGRQAGLPAHVKGPTFTVRVSLRDASITYEELLQETTSQLADFDPRFHRDSAGRAVVTLQVIASDLWVAVLLATGAVTSTGYRPERIEAMPSAEARSPIDQPEAHPTDDSQGPDSSTPRNKSLRSWIERLRSK
jgi:hypothetical protein